MIFALNNPILFRNAADEPGVAFFWCIFHMVMLFVIHAFCISPTPRNDKSPARQEIAQNPV